MRRWNGWGDDTIHYPLPREAAAFITSALGESVAPADANLAEVLATLPASRLAANPLYRQSADERLRHARGQSLPDWLALRSGQIDSIPDGVAYPQGEDDIAELLKFAAKTGAKLIPYGGGTSVVGHINPISVGAPTITVDMRHMNRMYALYEEDQLAIFGAGISGPELEAQLRAHGFTLGHYPQSFEYSTLGGWIATRSKGQQALLYGPIEALFAGGKVVMPAATLHMPPHPGTAAGPDLRQLALGSEGRLGFITEAAVRISQLPEQESFQGIFFPDFASGKAAVREIVQKQLPLSMLRLSTPEETETTLTLAGHERAISLLAAFLKLRGIAESRALLLAGFTGNERLVTAARQEAMKIAGEHGGINVGKQFGIQWRKSRFRTPYLRNTLWEMGYAVDTLETAVPWHQVDELVAQIETVLAQTMASFNERILKFSHLSHLYSSGASIYVTYIFRLAQDPQETLARWHALKGAASEAIVRSGATISHQHGVGVDHKAYLPIEKDPIGISLLNDALLRSDPQGIMNPGKLVDR